MSLKAMSQTAPAGSVADPVIGCNPVGIGRGLFRSGWGIGALMAIAASMAVLGVVVVLDGRHDTWRQLREASHRLSLALERDIRHDIDALDPPNRDMAGIEDARTLPHRNPLLALRDRSAVSLDAAPPLQGHRRDGRSIMSPGPPMRADDGRLAGVAASALRRADVQRVFETLDIGLNSAVTLLQTDGRVLARYPDDASAGPGESESRDASRRLSEGLSGQFVTRTSIDAVERLLTFERLGDLPLILTVGVATDDIASAWRLTSLALV